MGRHWLWTAALGMALSGSALAAGPSAQTMMRTAEKTAQASHRNVLVIFHASWCGWCHELDHFMATPEAAPMFARNFVVVRLDVLESGAKAKLDTPGGKDVMVKWGGGSSLPFLVILQPSGNVVVTSNRPRTGNVGYPVKADEVAWFQTMMQRGAPQLSAPELQKVMAAMRAFNRAHKLQ